MGEELRKRGGDGGTELSEVLEGVGRGRGREGGWGGGGRAGGREHEFFVEEEREVEIEKDGVVESEAEENADELEFLGVVEGVGIEPEEAGWGGGREGGR